MKVKCEEYFSNKSVFYHQSTILIRLLFYIVIIFIYQTQEFSQKIKMIRLKKTTNA